MKHIPHHTMKHILVNRTATELFEATFSLSDELGNGHAYFSATAVAKEFDGRRWRESFGGCCHEEILARFPDSELARLFVDLHLSDQDGSPMHCAANALYWLAGCSANSLGQEHHGGSGRDGESPDKCRKILRDMIRCTDAEIDTLLAFGPNNAREMSYFMEQMGFRKRFVALATKAKRELEKATGQTLNISESTRPCWPKLTNEEAQEIKARFDSGYYSPEMVAQRKAEKEAARLAKLRADAAATLSGTCRKAEREHCIALASIEILSEGRHGGNVIQYDHMKTIAFNWSDTRKAVSEDQAKAFEAFCRDRKPELFEGWSFTMKG